MNNSAYSRDPTKPDTPAFTKPLAKREVRVKVSRNGGLLSNPIAFARFGKMPEGAKK